LQHFCLLQAAREKKKTVIFLTNVIKTKTNVCTPPGFLKDQRKLLVVSKQFGNGPEQKPLDENCLVLIKTFCNDPEFCFKNEFILSYLHKRRKQASHLERTLV
jgi:hypothetical protein